MRSGLQIKVEEKLITMLNIEQEFGFKNSAILCKHMMGYIPSYN